MAVSSQTIEMAFGELQDLLREYYHENSLVIAWRHEDTEAFEVNEYFTMDRFYADERLAC